MQFLLQYFPDFIDQQVKIFDQENDPSVASRKRVFEFSKPTVEEFDGKFYFLGGPAEIHLLNHEKNEAMDFYSIKLTQDEINELPVDPIYVGTSSSEVYLNDEKKALDQLLKIITKMNSMQDPKFYSFPLGMHQISMFQFWVWWCLIS